MAVAPTVSVVVPVYNRGNALRPTVDSVLTQTFPDWELILVDDGSTDDTPQVCQSYGDPRIRYVRQENAGHAVARNRGLAEARGALIAFLDHDDRWLPTKLERQVEHLGRHREHGVVYARWERIGEAGEILGPGEGGEWEGRVFHELLRHGQFLWTMSLPLMHTELVRQVGGFDPQMDTSDDHDLFLKLARVTEFGFIPETLLQYNVGNGEQQSRQKLRLMTAHLRCLERHLPLAEELTAADRDAIRYQWRQEYGGWCREHAWNAMRKGDAATAWTHMRAAVRFKPSTLRDPAFLKDLAALAKGAALGGLQAKAL